MHQEFCMISDRPSILTIDDKNRPHNATGPFCQWRDGSALFCWHGVRIPAKYYIRPHTAQEILAEPNAEVRRALIERYDELHATEDLKNGKWLLDVGAKVIDSCIQPMAQGEPDAVNELLEVELPDDPEGRMLAIRMIDPSTSRQYIIRVHPECRPLLKKQELGKPQKLTVLNALASTHGLRGEEYVLLQES